MTMLGFGDMVARYRMNIKGILHLGAHKAEEAAEYAAHGISSVVWVEANPELVPIVRANVAQYDHAVIEACLGERDGDVVTFHITNNGMSSSILPLKKHLEHVKDVWEVGTRTMTTTTVDTLAREFPATFSFLNYAELDLQGAELAVLRGMVETLEHMDYLLIELNYAELYAGCGLAGEVKQFLAERGFVFKEEHLTPHEWSDGLFIREGLRK